MFNILVKNIATIIYDKKRRIFFVKYETPNLTEDKISKILDVYKQIVDQEDVVLINDFRENIITSKEVVELLKSTFQFLKIKSVVIINSKMQSTLINLFLSVNKFPNKSKIKVLASYEEALRWAANQLAEQ